MVLGESLYRFEKVGGERQLVTQLLLTVDQEGMVLTDLGHGGVGVVHVLTVSAVNPHHLLTVLQESLRYQVRPEY